MRGMAVVLAVAVATACSTDVTAPMEDEVAATLAEMASLAYGVTQVGDAGPGAGLMERLAQLPAEIALSSEQLAQITAHIDAFVAATAADRAALLALREEAAAARAAGASKEEVQAIMEPGQAIRRQLHEAERALVQAIIGTLTQAQRAWLMNRPPPQPRPCALTEAQRAEISTLRAAYEADNATDIATVRSTHERAVAAKEAGASRQEVAAIVAEGRAALERLKAARAELHEAVLAVLTAEQRAAGCMS
jgi:hypothetical protein